MKINYLDDEESLEIALIFLEDKLRQNIRKDTTNTQLI